MRHLPLPANQDGEPYVAGEVARICIESIEMPEEFINRITPIIPDIIASENQYGQLAGEANLHNFPRLAQVEGPNGIVTADELKRLYSYRMLNVHQPGRAIYDRLILSAGDVCPLCGVRGVSTLDHHLPKSDYPILSVAAMNLIPACRDCQSEKHSDFPRGLEDQTLHPYYDNFDTDVWLTAVVDHTEPASFVFGVTPPATWTRTMAARVRHHMDSFGLGRLFAMNAANELTGIRFHLTGLFGRDGGGDVAVQADLRSRANSWRQSGLNGGRLNSWQLAMYQAAAEDDWFCSGGFARE